MNGGALEFAIPLELRLLVDCCKLNFPRMAAGRLLDLDGLDWSRFCRLAAFHRVEGLAWSALQPMKHALPANAANELEGAALAIVAQNLKAAQECKELLSRFQDGKIPLLFLKGLTMGAIAYRTPLAKAAVDLDILIDPADIGSAAEVLAAAGYRQAVPSGAPLTSWHRQSKESVWANDTKALQLDLHTRTADNKRLIPKINVHSPCQSVRILASIDLPTLAPDELFAYLAVHGASSLWFRLKWVADFAGLLDSHTGEEVERLYARSQELGAGRPAGQALLVADLLFGTLEPCASLRHRLLDDLPVRMLARMAARFLTREPLEPTSARLGTMPIHAAQFLLMPGMAYKWSELSGQSRRFLSRAHA